MLIAALRICDTDKSISVLLENDSWVFLPVFLTPDCCTQFLGDPSSFDLQNITTSQLPLARQPGHAKSHASALLGFQARCVLLCLRSLLEKNWVWLANSTLFNLDLIGHHLFQKKK